MKRWDLPSHSPFLFIKYPSTHSVSHLNPPESIFDLECIRYDTRSLFYLLFITREVGVLFIIIYKQSSFARSKDVVLINCCIKAVKILLYSNLVNSILHVNKMIDCYLIMKCFKICRLNRSTTNTFSEIVWVVETHWSSCCVGRNQFLLISVEPTSSSQTLGSSNGKFHGRYTWNWKQPLILVHCVPGVQLCVPSVHSSTSIHVPSHFTLNPDGHSRSQLNPPSLFVQVASSPQIVGSNVHSSTSEENTYANYSQKCAEWLRTQMDCSVSIWTKEKGISLRCVILFRLWMKMNFIIR